MWDQRSSLVALWFLVPGYHGSNLLFMSGELMIAVNFRFFFVSVYSLTIEPLGPIEG